MSLIQILKEEEKTITKKQLTPDTLFPKWSEALDYIEELNRTEEITAYTYVDRVENIQSRLGINICNNQYCVVGESHGFSPDASYGGCSICTGYACSGPVNEETGRRIIMRGPTSFIGLSHYIKNDMLDGSWREQQVVKEFIKHYEEKHL